MYVIFSIGKEYSKKDFNSLLSIEVKEFMRNFAFLQQNFYKEIDKKHLLKVAFEAVLKELNDPYTGISNTVTYNIVDGKIIVEDANEGDGLNSNDEIIEINGVSLEEKSADDIEEQLKKLSDEYNVCKVRRKNEVKTLISSIGPDRDIPTLIPKIFADSENKMGYLPFYRVDNELYIWVKEMLNKLEKERITSLILDLRNCCGGEEIAQNDILSLFLDKTHPLYQLERRDGIKKTCFSNGKETKKYPIVILIGPKTASAAEIITTALSEQYGATIIGENSFGKGWGQVNAKSLNYKFRFTVHKWYTSNGKWIGDEGIKPDKFVKNNFEKDNQLEAAIKYLSKT